MAVSLVQIVVDEYNGAGVAVTQGTAEFTPQVSLRDVADGMGITQAQVPAAFSASGPPTVGLIPTDAPGPQPSGWAWTVGFVNVPGTPPPFAFFCPAGPCSFTVTDASPAVFTWTPASAFTAAALTTLPNGTIVTFATLTGASGFATATPYYVVGSASGTFGLSATRGGSPIASTSAGSGTFTVTQYNLSALAPLTSLTPLAAAMPLPSGTPTAGQVPVATGTGEASVWTTPAEAGDSIPLPSGTPTTGQVPVVTAVSPLALDWGVGGGGGISPPAGDIGGTSGSPTVVSTHLAAALPVNQGGTGQVSQQTALDALAGAVTSGEFLRGNGSHVVMGGIQAGDLPSTAVSAGSYTSANITVGADGRLTAASSGGGAGVTSVTAGDTSIVIGGTSGAPTVETGTLDVIASDHPPAANWSNNSKKITNVANGSASADIAAYGQTPAGGNTVTIGQGGTGATTAGAALTALGAAPLASPALTGTPTAPTQTTGDSSTRIATDAFVATAVAAETTRAETAEALLAPKASPALTGTPTAPTQAAGDASAAIATDAFVAAAAAASAAYFLRVFAV